MGFADRLPDPHPELKQSPESIGKLDDACDLTESCVREALDVATDDGMVYPVNGGANDDVGRYALDESKVGGVAFVRSNGRRIL